MNFIAFIVDNTETVGKGILYCWPEADEEYIAGTPHTPEQDKFMLLPVIYTSPYSSHQEGAIVAIPSPGTRIIVQQVENKYYYIASILPGDPKEDQKKFIGMTDIKSIRNFSAEGAGHRIYGKDGEPNTILIKHPRGHRLQMTEDRDDIGETFISKAELRSGRGKRLTLDDSIKVDSVKLGIDRGLSRYEFDGITIGHNGNRGIGPRSIRTETQNNIQNISWEGSIRNKVVNGKNWHTENTSKAPIADAAAISDPFNFGHANLGSQYGDINIQTGSENPRDETVRSKAGMVTPTIYLTQKALGGSIKIDSNGDVRIYAKTLGISIEALKDIGIFSQTGDINLMAPLGAINMSAGAGIHAITLGNVEMKGTQVHLNHPSLPTGVPLAPTIINAPTIGTSQASFPFTGPGLYVPFPSFLML